MCIRDRLKETLHHTPAQVLASKDRSLMIHQLPGVVSAQFAELVSLRSAKHFKSERRQFYFLVKPIWSFFIGLRKKLK